jgi:type VI secretion system protein VasJ
MGADEAIESARARLEGLTAPIDGGVGRDVSYDASFEGMKAEVDKLQSLEGGRVDWAAVVSAAEQILESESKDFRVVLYYGVGLSQTSGAPGVFDGLVVLDALIEKFWEPMYPPLKRPRARGNVCSWFNDFTAPVVDAWTPTLADRDVGLGLERIFRRVDGELADKLGDAYPGMTALREAIRRLVQRLPAEAPPPPPPPPPSPPKAEAAPASSASPASTGGAAESGEVAAADEVPTSTGGGGGYSPDDIVDSGSAYTVLAEISPVLKRAAQVFRDENAASPEAHRLVRIATLLFLNAPLPAEAGETTIDPPDATAIEQATALHASQDWEALARLAEETTAAMPLWLDGHCHAARAYENLGEPYDGARRVIEGEIAALALRSPGIVDLRFAGGTPFATDDAKAWIAGLTSGGGGGGGGASKDPVAKAVVQAQELLAAEQLPQAVALLQRTASSAASPMVRFRAKLEGAKILLVAGFADLARAQLEGLDRLVERHRLDEWDPDLAVQLYATLYRAQRLAGHADSEVPEVRARVLATWERLCQLDGAAALRAVMEA